jgi:hypothetical protein
MRAGGVKINRCHLTGAQLTALLEHRDRRAQIRRLGGQPPHPQLVLVFGGAGDRPGPPRRRHRGDRLLTLGPPGRPAVSIQHTTTDPSGELASIHRPQKHADRGQRRRLGLAHLQPGANPHTRRPRSYHRISDPPQRRTPGHGHILTATTDNRPQP